MRDYSQSLLRHCGLEKFVVHQRRLEGRPARTASLPFTPAPEVAAALSRAGIRRLYSHQAEALEVAADGRPVLVVTPTASGKSLVYNLTVLQACAERPAARALYLFPFKALEQDQKAAFESLAEAFPADRRPRCEIYDGDTKAARRRQIKADPPQVLITNPDMLHMGILAHHGDWAGFLSGLEMVVIDELHVYRGVFGTHLHHIVQRLRRLCAHYGSAPAVVAASATVGEPERLARELLGEPFTTVKRSGAARAGRELVFLQPRMELSPYTVATRLMARTVGDGRRTITFTKSRRITELIHSWLVAADGRLRHMVEPYRAGYLPEQRRDIETRLASGDLMGVVSTSALELGVDIGGLDVCILVGYPGSITSSWQRIGRVGRGDQDSLVILVGMPDALDQYFLSHPEQFFQRPFEPVAFDPANPVVAASHLVCAGAELPLDDKDADRYGPEVFGLIPRLVASRRLVQEDGARRWYALQRRPQRDVGLRSMGSTYRIRGADGRPMGTVDSMRARTECHTGAIYLQRGRTYRVTCLDLEKRQIDVVPAFDIDYFTVVLTDKETEILERREQANHGIFTAGLGRLKVTTRFKGYLRKSLVNQEVISEHDLDLPPSMFETLGLWVELPPGLEAAVASRDGHFMGAIHACEHAGIGLFPLLALCDRGDLGGISYPRHPQIGGPAFFIYDGHAGGMGLAAEGFRRIPELLERTRELLSTCDCEEGCPSCIQSPRCGNGNRPLDKKMALYLLDVLTGREQVPPPPVGPRQPAKPAVSRRSKMSGPAVTTTVKAPIEESQPHEVAGGDDSRGLPVAKGVGSSRTGSPAAPAARDLFFDLETLRSAAEVGGWNRAAEMGLALACVYDRGRDRWRTYREDDARDLIIDLLSAHRVVGFNIRKFDYLVLSGYADADFSRIPTLDLLEEVHRILGFRLSLAHLAEETLGVGKSADGLQSLAWVKEGRWDLIEAYCRRDVEVTRQLYEFGCRERHLVFRNREGRRLRLPVSWD